MSIEVQVDAVTFVIARLLTAGGMAVIGGAAASMAADKYELTGKLRLPTLYATALGAGVASFLLGWASIKISIVIGIGLALVGGVVAFAPDESRKGVARVAGGVALLAIGTAWVGWNLYLMFS